jgi:hypothetical protein
MRRIIRLMALAALVGCTQVRADHKHDALVGLWSGVDNVDGSLRTVSISDPNGNGVYTVLAHDTYWSLCEGDRGIGRTTGSADEYGIIHAAGTVKCHSGQTIDLKVDFEPIESPGGAMLREHVLDQPFETLLFRISAAPPTQ